MTDMKRLLVTGSRWAETPEQQAAMAFHFGWMVSTEFPGHSTSQIILVHGGATGADAFLAGMWEERGYPTEVHPYKKELGRAGGPVRNQEMVDLGADFCLAFPVAGLENQGTADCVRRARKAGIKTMEILLPMMPEGWTRPPRERRARPAQVNPDPGGLF